MNFGENLKTYRKERKMTQEQLAVCLNVSRQSISNWENEINFPELEMLVSISNVFGLSLDQLLFGKENIEVKRRAVQAGKQAQRTVKKIINF